MPMMLKPCLDDPSNLQDDHSMRTTDICFRHLEGAYSWNKKKEDNSWWLNITNDDPCWGGSEFMVARRNYLRAQSEEYTQSIAATIFAHVWILSAANEYHSKYQDDPILKRTDCPIIISESLNLPKRIVELATTLKNTRNALMHLVANSKKHQEQRVQDLDFKQAYYFVKGTWVIFNSLIRQYGHRPDRNNWIMQSSKYYLPRTVDNKK